MELQFLIVSFIAGVLTILAPCIFPLLPILVSSSVDGDSKNNRAFTIIISLLASIAVFTLLLSGSSSLLNLGDGTLRAISATILLAVGAFMAFPQVWEQISVKLGFEKSSNSMLAKAMGKQGKGRDILIGASLGPVFSSCSPTYAIIVATIIPQEFATGLVYLLVYLIGLGLMFALIAILGQKLTSKLAWATDPNGWFKKIIGYVFIFVALAIFFNLDKSFESWLLNSTFYDELIRFEIDLRN